MNNKDFVNTLASQTGVSLKETKRLIEDFIQEFADHADDGTTFTIQGFGSFEVKKKLERIVNNPTTKQRMLVPPKLVLSFRPGAALKDRVKEQISFLWTIRFYYKILLTSFATAVVSPSAMPSSSYALSSRLSSRGWSGINMSRLKDSELLSLLR